MRRFTLAAAAAAAAWITFGGMSAAAEKKPWQHGLYLGNGNSWRKRVRLEMESSLDRPAEGLPGFVKVGKGPGEADLAGERAEAVRLVSSSGEELLFGIRGPGGSLVTAGPIPQGSALVVPVECPARSKAECFVYFDNERAWEVPDFFDARPGLENGGLEDGEESAPASWDHAEQDEKHRSSWASAGARSGARCLKTEVAPEAEPTWVQTRQEGITVHGGVRYELSAWVKARDVKGTAGIYIHLGTDAEPMIGNHVISAGEGSYDWKEVTAEIVAPAGAVKASVGTVLHGTGTAWFDDFKLEPKEGPGIKCTAAAREELPASAAEADPGWPADSRWSHRFRVFVPPGLPSTPRPRKVHIDLAPVCARLRSSPEKLSFLVRSGEDEVRHLALEGSLFFEAAPGPAGSPEGRAYQVYMSRSAMESAAPPYDLLLNDPGNLVKNPDFESGARAPDAWTDGADGLGGQSFSLDAPGKFGGKCARIHIPHDAGTAWRGWRQDVPVRPGATCLYAAWIKCRDLQGNAQIHAHLRKASGDIVSGNWAVGAGPPISGTTDWTLLKGVFEVPAEATTFQIHLTTEATGTLWHDGVLVVEVTKGEVGPLEARPLPTAGGLVAWPVNSLVKVFREDLPPESVPPARITAARNEKEPLQVAIRGPASLKDVRVALDPPAHASGTKLTDLSVAVVGYVPIDHPTNYYTTQGPRWKRMIPKAPGASDGWAGMWPDPLLPRDRFDLGASATQPVWITLSVPRDAPSGDYRGAVRFECGGKEAARLPFTVHVWDFALGDETRCKAIYDVRLGGRWREPGKTEGEVWRKVCRFMAERRVCPDVIQPPPRLQWRGGKVEADFAEFDRSAEFYFGELKLPHAYTPWQFYLFGWGFPPGEKFGEKPYEGTFPHEGVDRSKLRPQFKEAYQACLKVFWDHIREKGWASKFILYISDEPFFSQEPIRIQMQALCRMIHEVDRSIPVYVSTWHHVPEWDGSIDVWGISHYGLVSPEKIAELRSGGARVIWTTDGQMCTDTPYCAVERLLPHYAFQHGAEGYEFWGITWLTYDPYEFGWHSYIPQSDTPGKSYFVRYPNGDGFLAYPGGPVGHDGPVSSVRLEAARDGVEDHEYLQMLSKLVARARQDGKDAREAEAALERARGLVAIPNAGGRYSTRILPDPEAVFRVKEALARAMESQMGRPARN